MALFESLRASGITYDDIRMDRVIVAGEAQDTSIGGVDADQIASLTAGASDALNQNGDSTVVAVGENVTSINNGDSTITLNRRAEGAGMDVGISSNRRRLQETDGADNNSTIAISSQATDAEVAAAEETIVEYSVATIADESLDALLKKLSSSDDSGARAAFEELVAAKLMDPEKKWNQAASHDVTGVTVSGDPTVNYFMGEEGMSASGAHSVLSGNLLRALLLTLAVIAATQLRL
jgi:hypothetical protein